MNPVARHLAALHASRLGTETRKRANDAATWPFITNSERGQFRRMALASQARACVTYDRICDYADRWGELQLYEFIHRVYND